ncbi:hypothetical protein T11_13833 [Trichinella zimbabwensis]|uniref:MULE transposase domain-containing protein n=1 Tax=Trichinella zimbabwensis TaxID=268475 RepID=A0A0V1GVS5_9BILA|nr:hypothetical protein T11_13833 [Trichinella zimbabwensis]
MSDNSELGLVSNRCGKTSLVFETNAYKLKHRQTEQITGLFQSDKIGCRDAMCANLEVTDARSKKDHVESCSYNRIYWLIALSGDLLRIEHHGVVKHGQKQSPEKGDIVLIEQEGVLKNQYHLGRIIECYEGGDGIGGIRRVWVSGLPDWPINFSKLFSYASGVAAFVPVSLRAITSSSLCDVDAILIFAPHADDCAPDNDILYKMEKKNVLKRRAAEDMKTVPQIYHEEASSASADLHTAGLFPTYKSVKTAMYRKLAQRFLRLPPTRQQLEIPPHWRITKSGRRFLLYSNFPNETSSSSPSMFLLRAAALGVVLSPQPIICDFETALIPAVQGSFPGVHIQGCYFHFCQAVLRKVTGLGMRTSYIHEAATKKTVKMLLATTLDLLPEEWMAPNRMQLWNVYNVQIRTNSHLEDWHFKVNQQARKHHLSFYELLQLLIDEQCSTETLIQQVTSGRVTADDLQTNNKKYEQQQQRITALTAE